MKYASSALLSVLLAVAGCTVVPRLVTPSGPSWDAQTGRRDSGFIRQLPDHSFEVSTNVVETFRLLAPVYGSHCPSPITNAFGCYPTAAGTYVMSPSAVQDYLLMLAVRASNQSINTKP